MWWCAGACCTVSNPPKFNLEDKAEAEDCGNDRAQNNLEIQREVLDIHDSHVKWAKRLGRCTLGGIEGDVVMAVLEERGK